MEAALDLRPAPSRAPNPEAAAAPMIVVFWTEPYRDRTGTKRYFPTRLHATPDGAITVCGEKVPRDASVAAITPNWGERTTCLTCNPR